MRRAVAFLLVLEGLSSALRTASRLPVLAIYPWITIAFIAARLGVAFAQFAAGSMLMSDRPLGPILGQWVYATSAVLVTFELGLGFAPTNLFPAYRWPAVGLYWIYALAGIGYLAWTRRAQDQRTRNDGLGTRDQGL